MKTILITGGAGFIGSYLSELLLKKGNKVINIDSYNNYYNPEIKRSNASAAISLINTLGLPPDNYIQVEGDIRDKNLLNQIFTTHSIDQVVHLAACAGVRPSIENPQLYYDVNVGGTLQLLETMKEHNVTKLVFASSSSVYGNNKKVPFSEEDAVDHPISPYAATKKAGELLCHTYHHLYNINTACLRFFTVFGPRQRPDLAIHKFTKLIMAGQPIPFYGDGSSSRDYTYVDDIVDGIYKALQWVESDEKRYDVFNIGGSSPVSLSEMVAAIEHSLGMSAVLEKLPFQPGDVDITYADISKSVRVLDYQPNTPFIEGIDQFVRWYKEHHTSQ